LSEVLTVNEKRETKEVIVKLPIQFVGDLDRQKEQQLAEPGEFVYISTKKLVKQVQPNLIREAMIKGYVEMSHINLSIASECLHLEYEAEHTMERLVSGG
jgi:CopG family transcriptional regulator / antitoxin EndoAI